MPGSEGLNGYPATRSGRPLLLSPGTTTMITGSQLRELGCFVFADTQYERRLDPRFRKYNSSIFPHLSLEVERRAPEATTALWATAHVDPSGGRVNVAARAQRRLFSRRSFSHHFLDVSRSRREAAGP
jgi:hypothetical protein